mmetsp:Transcript_2011/g.3609  ORF Transcript_2011/g.3609 Transcript_2011/m.3609 type:complete len:87 (+) Transcript_2011:387-647(+)
MCGLYLTHSCQSLRGDDLSIRSNDQEWLPSNLRAGKVESFVGWEQAIIDGLEPTLLFGNERIRSRAGVVVPPKTPSVPTACSQPEH